ncbi:hypothetical protein LguiB_021148 [Lonicera macranthoides]
MMHFCNFSLPWNKLPLFMVCCSTAISFTTFLSSSIVTAFVFSASSIARSV